MRKLFATLSLLSFSFPFFEFANANEYDFYSLDADISADTLVIYGVKNGARTLLNSFQTTSFDRTWQYDDARYDQKTNSIIIPGSSDLLPEGEQESYWSFDLNSHEITELEEYRGFNGVLPAQDLIRKQGNVVSIGENSLKLKETETEQQLWGTNADGDIVPINITNGSKLLINGVEVTAGDSAQVTTNKNNISTNSLNIKNLGEGIAGSTALTAALTALPQTSKESKLSCGVGTGAYSSRYALGFGCASKVNERVDINAGGSYVFGGYKSYGEGTLDNGVIKAGFVFKLGELKKSTQISMKEKEELKQEISDLKSNNINIISQNKALLARLERLEKVALNESKSQDLATIKLP